MNPKIRVEIQIYEGEITEPAIIGTMRVPWPDDLSRDEAMKQAAERACRQLHAPQIEWTPC